MSADFQGYDFLNWPESIDFRPRGIFQPLSVADLASFVKTAMRDDRRVRAAGSAWSMSDVEISHDYLVDMTNFRGVLAMSSGATVWGYVEDVEGGSQLVPPR